MTKPLATWVTMRAAGALALRFAFSWDLVHALKAGVPVFARAYDCQTKTWTIAAPWADAAMQVVRRCGAAITISDERQDSAASNFSAC